MVPPVSRRFTAVRPRRRSRGCRPALEPSASLVVYQSIPTPGFFPGQLEALVDVRNIFDSVPVTEDGEILLNDYSRLVRAGLSFRF